jgi:two-component sensor histidine kinase
MFRPAGGERRNSLLGMLEDLFSPYGGGGEARVTVHGDDTPIAERAATPLALVFHELATNSAKYGALSIEGGTIDLTIADQGDALLLRWVEHGGTAARGRAGRGFGSQLIETSLTGQLGGSWERRFEPEAWSASCRVESRYRPLARGAVSRISTNTGSTASATSAIIIPGICGAPVASTSRCAT